MVLAYHVRVLNTEKGTYLSPTPCTSWAEHMAHSIVAPYRVLVQVVKLERHVGDWVGATRSS